jgi:hypothetical protein
MNTSRRTNPEGRGGYISVVLIIICGIALAAGASELFYNEQPSKPRAPSVESSDFASQTRAACDALELFYLARGSSISAAELEAQRKLDSVARVANTDADRRVVAALQKYFSAIRMVNADPSKENVERLQTASLDAHTVLHIE